MNKLTHDELQAIAPEFVLGLLDGSEQVDAQAHLTGCGDCRAHVADLSRTTDALLLIGPEAEPDAGFESMVLTRLRAERRRTSWAWRPYAIAAAVVAVLALSIGLVTGRATAPEQALRQAPIVAATGSKAGEVYLYQNGAISWCYVELAGSPHDGAYDVRATLRDGRVVTVESFSVKGGSGSYGKALTVPADDIVRMTLQSPGGRWSYVADFPA